jgi:hypothetical protein
MPGLALATMSGGRFGGFCRCGFGSLAGQTLAGSFCKARVGGIEQVYDFEHRAGASSCGRFGRPVRRVHAVIVAGLPLAAAESRRHGRGRLCCVAVALLRVVVDGSRRRELRQQCGRR